MSPLEQLPAPAKASAEATVIGACAYCGVGLYDSGPTSLLDEPLSHVACAVFARAHGPRQ